MSTNLILQEISESLSSRKQTLEHQAMLHMKKLNLAEPLTAETLGAFIQNLGEESLGLKKCIAALNQTHEAIEALKAFCEKYMIKEMDSHGVKQTDGLSLRFTGVATRGQVLVDETKLPKEFMKEKIVRSPDKEKIRAHMIELKEGVPGASIVYDKWLKIEARSDLSFEVASALDVPAH